MLVGDAIVMLRYCKVLLLLYRSVTIISCDITVTSYSTIDAHLATPSVFKTSASSRVSWLIGPQGLDLLELVCSYLFTICLIRLTVSFDFELCSNLMECLVWEKLFDLC